MNRKIKLIWDFYGNDALEIAKHHCIHLKEFAAQNSKNYYDISHVKLGNMYTIAYIVVSEADLKTYKDALKPHRGELA